MSAGVGFYSNFQTRHYNCNEMLKNNLYMRINATLLRLTRVRDWSGVALPHLMCPRLGRETVTTRRSIARALLIKARNNTQDIGSILRTAGKALLTTKRGSGAGRRPGKAHGVRSFLNMFIQQILRNLIQNCGTLARNKMSVTSKEATRKEIARESRRGGGRGGGGEGTQDLLEAPRNRASASD